MSTECSPGLDGFTMRELELLPECAWNIVAQLLTACEEAQFPRESCCWAATAMLPKDGGHLPSSIVPSRCLSFCGGFIWSPVAADSKLAGILCGTREGHTMSEVLFTLILDMEQAHVNCEESPVSGCFVDYTKYFDFFSYEFT